ncbi:cupin domain-containing protein [Halorientalis salina]|uniref:cupin domain-containing protein n=1 Tax=Halorientalis salina TaxID=2932266 RepID=UPI0010AC7999|nr:cupin domain-containing protein [Halorientalis salina]
MAEITPLDDLEPTPHASPFPGEEPKVVRLALEADERVSPHRHPDRQIICYVVSGALELELDDDVHELAAGDVARFDGRRDISPKATADSVALLVLARRTDE